ncbi:unnamed protein product [Microthlaspi erraticum]|uniref:Uncharacterized protein n=1 Tax=Microthlaspi erraticum TaxID=1685480 RepID=A0A6D2KX32_9BRAS|nr:unnamed protein product [Microthlaspi erraticum]
MVQNMFTKNRKHVTSVNGAILYQLRDSFGEEMVMAAMGVLRRRRSSTLEMEERNSRLHRAVTKPPAQVIREIQSTIRRKLYILDMDLRTSPTQGQGSDETYLSTWFGLFQR